MAERTRAGTPAGAAPTAPMFRNCAVSSAPQSWPSVTMRTSYWLSSELASAAAEGARSVLGAGVLTDGVADHASSTAGAAVVDDVAGSPVGVTDSALARRGDGESVGPSGAVAAALTDAAIGWAAGVTTESATMPAGSASDDSRPLAN